MADPRRLGALGGARVARQLRPAGERVLEQAARREHLGDDADVRAAEPPCDAHASARWRVAQLEALEHAGAHAAERLQRLDRGAREDGQLGVRAADRPVGRDDAPGDAVLGLDRAAPERDHPRQERVSRQRARLSSIRRSATSRSYQPSTTTSLPSGCL